MMHEISQAEANKLLCPGFQPHSDVAEGRYIGQKVVVTRDAEKHFKLANSVTTDAAEKALRKYGKVGVLKTVLAVVMRFIRTKRISKSETILVIQQLRKSALDKHIKRSLDAMAIQKSNAEFSYNNYRECRGSVELTHAESEAYFHSKLIDVIDHSEVITRSESELESELTPDEAKEVRALHWAADECKIYLAEKEKYDELVAAKAMLMTR